MSTAFAAKNGLTFTRYLCLIEFVSKYPCTFLIILSLIIKTVFFILFVDISFTTLFNGFSFGFNCEVFLCCCSCCCCCCSSFKILLVLCSDLSLLLGIFLFCEIIGEMIYLSCFRFSFNFLKNNVAIFFQTLYLNLQNYWGFLLTDMT